MKKTKKFFRRCDDRKGNQVALMTDDGFRQPQRPKRVDFFAFLIGLFLFFLYFVERTTRFLFLLWRKKEHYFNKTKFSRSTGVLINFHSLY